MDTYFTATDFAEKLANAEELATEFGGEWQLPITALRAYLFGNDGDASRRLYLANGEAIRAALRSLGWKGAVYIYCRNGISQIGFTKPIPLEVIIARHNAKRHAEAVAESPQQ